MDDECDHEPQEPHECPFEAEIHEAIEICTCCKCCTHECMMDI